MSILKNFLNLNFYVSDLDTFLSNFDHSHTKLSTSQKKERKKYQRIFKLRDKSTQQDERIIPFWDQF